MLGTEQTTQEMDTREWLELVGQRRKPDILEEGTEYTEMWRCETALETQCNGCVEEEMLWTVRQGSDPRLFRGQSVDFIIKATGSH